MIPYLHTKYGSIPTFTLFIISGTAVMLLTLHISLKKTPNGKQEEYFIIPKVVFSGVAGLLLSALFDAFFKYIESGSFELSGITFYGGLIGAMLSMYILLRLFKRNTQYSIKEWFDFLTAPFILFHIFGRTGCFFAGCCYGKNTSSFWGVNFPDNIENEIVHGGEKCYPTQLFEAAMLFIIFIAVVLLKNKFQSYIISYAMGRFVLEFLRGDNRGELFGFLSPAQSISVIIIAVVLCYKTVYILKPKKYIKI